MEANYVHKDTLTATDYVELNKNNEILMIYNQTLLKENRELKKQLKKTKRSCDFVDLNEMVENLEKENKKLKKQQKEFMTFLEDNWKETQDIWYIKILNKFKEIIGE